MADDLEGRDSHVFQGMITVCPRIDADVIDVGVDGAGTVISGVPVVRQRPEPLVQSPVTLLGSG